MSRSKLPATAYRVIARPLMDNSPEGMVWRPISRSRATIAQCREEITHLVDHESTGLANDMRQFSVIAVRVRTLPRGAAETKENPT